MPPVPTPRTWVPGELATAAILNTEIRDTANFYRRPPTVFVSLINNRSVANDVWQAIVGWSNFIDSENGYPGSGSTITIVRAGLYEITCQALFATSTIGGRALKMERIQPDTTRSIIVESGAISSCSDDFAGIVNVETTVRLGDPGFYFNAGDQVEIFARQTSGGALNLLGAASDKLTWAVLHWVAAF